jgi:hypothetical protein
MTFTLKHLTPSEDSEAQCLVQWARVTRYQTWRLADLLLLVPNGAYLGNDLQQRHITMARMKRQGFRNGVFDYILPVPRAPYPGLWIELKRRSLGIVSEEQRQFKADMEALGWKCVIARGWEEGREAIMEYLGSGSPSEGSTAGDRPEPGSV